MAGRISDEIKAEILTKIKELGHSVTDVSEEYGVSSKTVYNWLRKDAGGVSSKESREIARLRKENKELMEIVGKLTVVVEKIKKKEIRI